MKKKIGKKVDEPKPWYPKVESMVATQRRDPECVALMQQLETRKKGGVPALKLAGVSDERLCATCRCTVLMMHGNCVVRMS
jgi:hypothetical protein